MMSAEMSCFMMRLGWLCWRSEIGDKNDDFKKIIRNILALMFALLLSSPVQPMSR